MHGTSLQYTTLKNLSIINCLHQFTDHFPENSALSLVYRSSGQKLSHVQILNSQFHYNSIETAKIEGTSRAVIGNNYSGRGGALGIFINEPIVSAAVEMVIDRCNFTNNKAAAYGGAVYLTSNQLSSGHNLTLTNSKFDHNFAANGGGGIAQGSTKTGNSICLQIEQKSICHYHMISPQESVETVYHFCQDDIANREKLLKAVKALIDNVLKRWSKRKMVADNISAVIAIFGLNF